MIIYFNLRKDRIEFLGGKNEDNFVLSVLHDNANQRNYLKIITDALNGNVELAQKLKGSNLVVLPDEEIAYEIMKLPLVSASKIKSIIDLKINVLYPQKMKYDYTVLKKTSDSIDVAIKFYKKDVIDEIKKAFKLYKIKVAGFNFEAQTIFDYYKSYQIKEENYFAIKVSNELLKIILVLKNRIILCKNIAIDSSNFENYDSKKLNSGAFEYLEKLGSDNNTSGIKASEIASKKYQNLYNERYDNIALKDVITFELENIINDIYSNYEIKVNSLYIDSENAFDELNINGITEIKQISIDSDLFVKNYKKNKLFDDFWSILW